MSESEPISIGPISIGHGATGQKNGRSTQKAKSTMPLSFNRIELNQILSVYGRKVAEGEWRDYAIDHHTDRAIFSIFRHASEVPLYRIEKNPKLARRQGAFSVSTSTGQILRRGHDLVQVMKVLDRRLKLVKG
ncbi:MAG: DUF2794 domain-containing protein [Rhizobiales bacterium]|nr:DUF2794 domain-containing protein [Hyphomicrobiales bacterium]